MNPTVSIGKLPLFRTLTLEQGRAFISGKKVVKVVASAGTGKTLTAMAYASARPRARGLYMAFSKPAQEEAKHRLAALNVNCTARTQHSLAWDPFGRALSQAGKLNGRGGLRDKVTSDLLNINYKLAAAVNECLRNYMCSVDDRIGPMHLPDETKYEIAKTQSGAILENARKMWARMVNLSDKEAQATDDVYLKQWVMTRPILPYDYIIYDEAQDANALTAFLVSIQEHASRFYIGDPHQSIFAFRGSVNLMEELQADDSHVLTQSFRFTPNIGLLATTWLKHWKGSTMPIIGRGQGGELSPNDQTAYLSRTVAGLLAKAVEIHDEGRGPRIHWVKGFQDYRIQPIIEAYELYKGRTGGIVTDPVLRKMRSWAEFEEYVEATKDGESGPVMRLINTHKNKIPDILDELGRSQVLDASQAKVVLTTEHKSKGLEWPIVRLDADHFSFKDSSESRKKTSTPGVRAATVWKTREQVTDQEINLMYVAMTRAKKAIVVPPEVREWFAEKEETRHLFPSKIKAQAPQPEVVLAPR